jgi:hypothetical protein
MCLLQSKPVHRDDRVMSIPDLPRTLLVYVDFPGIIINSHSQTIKMLFNLGDKF